MIAYLDSILLELQGGEATYGLPSPDDPAYQRDLAKLELMWGQVKDEISAYRSGSADSSRLLSLSEDFLNRPIIPCFPPMPTQPGRCVFF